MKTEPMKIAIPLENERVSGHFGHPECFSMVSVDPETRRVLGEVRLTPPPHEPGRLPLWLAGHGVHVVLASGVGARAVDLMRGQGIEVQSGVPPLRALDVVRLWLEGNLTTTENACNHDGTDHECRGHG